MYPTTGTFEVVKNISGGELSVKSENENIAKAYTLNITGNTATCEESNAIAYSKEVTTNPIRTGYDNQDKYKYNWIIVGIIPGENYKLRYGYGTVKDGTVSTIDGKEVDAREYKSTIVAVSPMHEELQKAIDILSN